MLQCRHFLLFVSSLTNCMLTIGAVERSLKMSIYPPPVSDDYYYRIEIYCNRHSSTEAALDKKLIAEHIVHGKKKSHQNVTEGQFVENEFQNCDKHMNGNYSEIQDNTVAQNKVNFTVKITENAQKNVKQCVNNEVFIKIVKNLSDGKVTNRSEKLLKIDQMTIEQFDQTNQFDYDFEEEYCKTFEIVFNMENKPFEFTVLFSKASGVNSQGFMLIQDFVIFKTVLTGRTVRVTVPIKKQHKISERRGDIRIKIKYDRPNTNLDNKKETNFVKVYWINDQMWNKFDSFTVDLSKDKVEHRISLRKSTESEKNITVVPNELMSNDKKRGNKGKNLENGMAKMTIAEYDEHQENQHQDGQQQKQMGPNTKSTVTKQPIRRTVSKKANHPTVTKEKIDHNSYSKTDE